jgi:hypothetical protein
MGQGENNTFFANVEKGTRGRGLKGGGLKAKSKERLQRNLKNTSLEWGD